MNTVLEAGRQEAPRVYTSLDRRTLVEIGSEVERAMLKEAIRCAPLETGGLLLGEVFTSGRLLRITYALGPPRGAEHRHASFLRPEVWPSDLEPYLPAQPIGEWHTHPASSPMPSWRDRLQMAWHARRMTFGPRLPLLLILGGSPSSTPLWSVALIGRSGRTHTLTPL